MEFQLNSEDSFMLIHSVSILPFSNEDKQWINFIDKIELTAGLKYDIFEDNSGTFIDERKNEFPIHLVPGIFQIQPVFQVNLLIKNETFTLGIGTEQKYYQKLIFELHHFEELQNDFTLEFKFEKFKLNTKNIKS